MADTRQRRATARDSATANIFIKDVYSLIVPNSFSPNDDGLNETFAPVVTNLGHYRLTIFNRWGETVFEGAQNKPWNGHYSGGPAPVGVYLYKLEVKERTGEIHYSYGTLNLLR